MKRFLLAAAVAASLPAMAVTTYMQAPAPEAVNPDSTGFKFTDVKILKHTPVKDQNKSGTCWSFSGTSALESEVLRKGGPELDLSEMYAVRNCYIDKAKKYIRTHGASNFSQGGSFEDVLYSAKNYGVMPEEAYNGLNYGEKGHVHGEMESAMKGYLDAIMRNPNRKLSTAWLKGLEGILDAYLGPVPETFTYNGKTYTPQSFAKEMGVVADDFINITSFNHHPFYEEFAVEIPDNWQWSTCMNVPLDEFKAIIDNALENGYTIGWAADVSEGGFKWAKGFCVNPEPKTGDNLEGTELARWVKLSAAEKNNATYDIKGPVKEKNVTQESRQQSFDNFQTTDDHGMEIVGIAKDQKGNRFYKVKNSWNKANVYDGYFYVSEPYVLEKTISFMVNKNAIPANISKKFKK